MTGDEKAQENSACSIEIAPMEGRNAPNLISMETDVDSLGATCVRHLSGAGILMVLIPRKY